MDIRGWCHAGHKRGGVTLDTGVVVWCHVGHKRGGVMLNIRGWCHVGRKREVSCWT